MKDEKDRNDRGETRETHEARVTGAGEEPTELIKAERDKTLAREEDEPPIVARMVIEIRSDGTRTIARGAAEDAASGEKVAIEIKGTTPLALALSLMKTMATVPSLARTAMKALGRDSGKKRRDD